MGLGKFGAGHFNGPKSIAIIPDGNRRYAQKNKLPLFQAYSNGFSKVNQVLEWAEADGVKSVSFWALSLENFNKRSELELNVLFGLMRDHIRKAFNSPELMEKGVRVKFFGSKQLMPKGLLELFDELESRTAENNRLELNVGVAYSGQEELLHASKLLAADIASGKVSSEMAKRLTIKDFEPYLYTRATPDLIIRTGNVQRLSGFLPFQSAYSEYFFCPALWPEFSREDFEGALDYYSSVQRRFGQ
jgi:undecaprenyl diphosphate synthase